MAGLPDPDLQSTNLQLVDVNQGDPPTVGQERCSGGAFRRRDAQGVYNPRTVWLAGHEPAAVLSHLLDEWLGGSTYCAIAGYPFVTGRTYYSDSNQTRVVASVAYTRNANQQVTQRVTRVFAADGTTVSEQATDTFTYGTQGQLTSIARSATLPSFS